MDVVAKASVSDRSRPNVDRTAKYLVENNLRVVQADKEGFLVVVPNDCYLEKAFLAVNKCFKKCDVNVENVKKKAVELLKNVTKISLRHV